MQFSPDGTGLPTHPKFPAKHETINSVLLGSVPIDKNIIDLIEYLAVNQISTHDSCEGSRKEGHNSLAYIVFVNYSHLTLALELLRNLAEEKQKDVLAWRIAGYYSVPDGRVDAESMLNGRAGKLVYPRRRLQLLTQKAEVREKPCLGSLRPTFLNLIPFSPSET